MKAITNFIGMLCFLVPTLPATAGPRFKVADVKSVEWIGDTAVIDLGSITYFVDPATLKMHKLDVELTGSFTSVSASTPNVLSAEYIDRHGVSHKITTDCNGMTREACFESHKKMLELYKSVFPPK